MHDIGTLRCSVRCAHVCLSARLFPCAWRTLLKAGTVEQVYESCGVRFRCVVKSSSIYEDLSHRFLSMANATWGWVLEAGGTGVNFRRFHHLNCALGSLPPLWGKVRKGGSGRLQHYRTPPHPVPLPQGERGPSSVE